uniref:G-protein coupled receptors family 1 profile domain-containing protein n=1 Tax=Clytia hemisphaerica TaxID=252671 RepID=A0A7M6DKV5_9CNID
SQTRALNIQSFLFQLKAIVAFIRRKKTHLLPTAHRPPPTAQMSSFNTTYSNLLYTTISPIIGTLVVILNSIEYFCIRRIEKLERSQSTNILYIKSLCISDILAGVFMIILKSMNPFMDNQLKGNKAAEEIYLILRLVFIRFSLFSSIFNLTAMTLDRYTSIFWAIQRRNQRKSFVYKIILGTWVFSLMAVLIIYCIHRWGIEPGNSLMSLVFPISSYPVTLIYLFCYTKIYLWIRNRSRTNVSVVSKEQPIEGQKEARDQGNRNNKQEVTTFDNVLM